MLDPDGRRTQKGMTTTAQPRVHAGVPAGGEFTAFGHSDNVPGLLRPAAPMGLTIMEDTSWMTPEQNAQHMKALQRLSEARIEGTITRTLSVGGDDFEFVSPEGHKFHLIIQDTASAIRRMRVDEDHVDPAHRGTAQLGYYSHSTPEKIQKVVDFARAQARVADAWAASTSLRSSKSLRFGLPRTGTNPSGDYVEMLVETEHGAFDVRAARHTGALTVAPKGTDQILSPRMTQAFLEDLTEDTGAAPSELSTAMTKTIATATGETW